MKKLFSLCIIFVSCFVYGQDVKMTIAYGYGNILPTRPSLQPVVVMLHNEGSQLIKGQLFIHQENFIAAKSGRLYRQEVILPGNSKKALIYYMVSNNNFS